MLFDRRVKPTFLEKARNMLWPRSGLRRSTRYLTHHVKRMPGSPYAIAAGFACGASVSMLPFPGFHFLLHLQLFTFWAHIWDSQAHPPQDEQDPQDDNKYRDHF